MPEQIRPPLPDSPVCSNRAKERKMRKTPCCSSLVSKKWRRKRLCSRRCLPDVRRNSTRRSYVGVNGLVVSKTIWQNAWLFWEAPQLPASQYGPSARCHVFSPFRERIRILRWSWKCQSGKTNGRVKLRRDFPWSQLPSPRLSKYHQCSHSRCLL